MSDKTNLSELAEMFPSQKSDDEPIRIVRGIKLGYWQDGMTYEQALAAQEADFERVKAKMNQFTNNEGEQSCN